MKFRKANKVAVILTTISILIFAIFCILAKNEEELHGALIVITIAAIIFIGILVVINYMRGSKYEKLYYKFNDGKKITGYVVDTFTYWYHASRNDSGRLYGIKVLANNKIYVVRWIENNDKFWKLESKVKNFQFDNGIISMDKIPVDVYLKNDDYYVDIKSIKI